jgi:large subunit ribosomal protein L18
MGKTNPRLKGRLRRKKHIRKTVRGTAAKPRLVVFRSAKHMYAQIVDDVSGTTLASASSLKLDDYGGNKGAASAVGKLVAERAKEASVSAVVFDRNGFKYHGRVAALADAAREAGLEF